MMGKGDIPRAEIFWYSFPQAGSDLVLVCSVPQPAPPLFDEIILEWLAFLVCIGLLISGAFGCKIELFGHGYDGDVSLRDSSYRNPGSCVVCGFVM
jgi:hypothetical protein